MKLAVAATAPFGADVLRGLLERHHVVALLTRPDAPRGRGRKVEAPPAKQVALEARIPVLQPTRLDDEMTIDADAIVVAAYGLLIPETLLGRQLWLNVHPSLLPRWRGAAPVERAIMAGDAETGVTIHETVKALDAGPIGAQRAFAIGADDDAGAVFARAAAATPDLIDDVLARQEFAPQPDDGVTYAEKITAADRELDWSLPAQQLHDHVRALSPHIGARGVVDGRNVIVWRTRVAGERLELLELQPEGKRRMTYEEFRRGVR